MKDLNQNYYVIEKPSDSSLPLLKADKDSSAKKYYSKEYLFDGQPLVFSNKKKEKQLKKGIEEKISSILFTAEEIIVDDLLYKKLKGLEISGVDYIPAVYVANDGSLHENYWYVRIASEHDVWCRTESEYSSESRSSSGNHYVTKYVLDQDAVNDVPLEQRMLFNMGGVSMPVICAHTTLVEAIKLHLNVDDELFISLSDYYG